MFDGEHRPLCHLPRHGRAHAHDQLGRQDVQLHRAGRSAGSCGPAELVTAVRTAKQFLTYANGAPFQPAVAVGLGLGDEFYAQLCDTLRDQARPALRRPARGRLRGVRPARHVLRHRRHPIRGGDDGLEFCRSLPERCGVVAVPSSVFYEDPATGRHLVRFAFCKRIEVLTEAAERLALPGMSLDPARSRSAVARPRWPTWASEHFGGPVTVAGETSEHRRRVRLVHPRGRPDRRAASRRVAGTARGAPAAIAVAGSPGGPRGRRPGMGRGAWVHGTPRPRRARCRRWVRPSDAGDGTGTRHDDARGGHRQALAGARLVDQLATLALRLHALPTDGFPPDAATVVDHRLSLPRQVVAQLDRPDLAAALRRAEELAPLDARRARPWCATATSTRST